MKIIQKKITIPPKKRGFHIITKEILNAVPEINEFSEGIAHIFIQHTSASLSINENADPTVRRDMEKYFNNIVPEELNYLEHTIEGPDDMTAHIKCSIFGSGLSVPITNGKFNLGTWQGIYLCEHRNNGGERDVIITIIGN